MIDINSDNKSNIIVANREMSYVAVFFNACKGMLLPRILYLNGNKTELSTLSVIDANGDSKSDAVVTIENQNIVDVFLSYGNDTFRFFQNLMSSSIVQR